MGTGVDEAQAQTFFTSDDTTYNVLVVEANCLFAKKPLSSASGGL